MGRKKSTKEEFIANAMAVHGEKYGYDNVVYNGDKEKVMITCPIHGDFPMTPNHHKAGCGCPYCAGNKKKTTEEFIKDARAVHGNRYNYDKAEYKGALKDVIITCPEHGDFPMLPNNHTSKKCGCPYCAKEAKTMTTEEFIAKATEKHGDKYDYSLVEINGNNQTKVKIKCSRCGCIFEQRINNHLNGQGCPKCAREARAKTTEEFIVEARSIHGDKYSYDKVRYVNTITPVIITCPKHGDFPMLPNNHISGKNGCPKCAREARVKTTEEFIVEARVVHGDKYTYDKVKYEGWYKKVMITCPIHGDFPQMPSHHKAGCGCPWCKSSHLETKTKFLLEQANIKYEPQKAFPWLKSNKNWPMSLDFYLTEYNIAIECQGEQHYVARGTVFTEEKVDIIKQRDSLKLQLCKEHGIPIYYIKYNEDTKEGISRLINNLANKSKANNYIKE